MTTSPPTRSATSRPQERTWRVTTATRVLVLALAVGQVLSAGDFQGIGIMLLALGLLAGVACVFDLDPIRPRSSYAPVIEGVLAAVLIGTAEGPVEPLYIYLMVPPVVAGVRSGYVATMNTSFAMAGALIGAWSGAQQLGRDASHLQASIPWLVIGFGGGLLAARQTREAREMKSAQAPYAAAHRLVSQLHNLSRKLPMGLDSPTVADGILVALAEKANSFRGCLLVRAAAGHLESLAHRGTITSDLEELAKACVASGRLERVGSLAAFPVRVGDDTFGALVLARSGGWDADLDELQEELDAHALRLDTALLFDDVRSLATSEERSRLAREIHDGVAQEIASLGYAIDELAATSSDPATRDAAATLRLEVSRVVSELRLSILDLRHNVEQAGGLSGALAEYIRAVSGQTHLRVHLILDENGDPLPRRTEAELLRIAQEAISNVRKHSGAENLWVTLSTDGRNLRLSIVDDGEGEAAPKAGHYGMHTMRERAEGIGAQLLVEERPGGGTIITVQSWTGQQEGAGSDDKRVAR